MKRLAIITTHPIQYNAPMFKLLSEREKIKIKVFYTWGEQVLKDKYDPGFGKIISWDIPLLQGYDYLFVKNISKDPGSHHHKGIVNPDLIQEIRKWQADAILVYGWNFDSHLKCMKYFKCKIPVYFRGDSTLLDDADSGIKKIIKKLLLRWVYRHVDFALYVGTANKNYFKQYGLVDQQLVWVPHAIDNMRFSECLNTKFRFELGITKADILFLFAGKFEQKKDPILLLKSFIEFNREHTHLLFVGNGHLEKHLKSVFESCNDSIKRRIHFMDFQNQSTMPSIYKSCDVFVLPSKGPGETWGLALNEAMAASKAVIASDKCGGSMDLITIGKNGYIFRAGDKNDLLEKFNILLVEKDRLNEMGQASFSIITDFSFEVICGNLENLVLSN